MFCILCSSVLIIFLILCIVEAWAVERVLYISCSYLGICSSCIQLPMEYDRVVGDSNGHDDGNQSIMENRTRAVDSFYLCLNTDQNEVWWSKGMSWLAGIPAFTLFIMYIIYSRCCSIGAHIIHYPWKLVLLFCLKIRSVAYCLCTKLVACLCSRKCIVFQIVV